MAPGRYPTWASGGAMGIYSWSLPVVIGGSLLTTLGIMMIDPLRYLSISILIVTSIGKGTIKMTTN